MLDLWLIAGGLMGGIGALLVLQLALRIRDAHRDRVVEGCIARLRRPITLPRAVATYMGERPRLVAPIVTALVAVAAVVAAQWVAGAVGVLLVLGSGVLGWRSA